MNAYLIPLRSLTQAQSAQRIVQLRGIAAQLVRTPKAQASRGCGYSLQLTQPMLQQALPVLHERGIVYQTLYRILADGSVEEVAL